MTIFDRFVLWFNGVPPALSRQQEPLRQISESTQINLLRVNVFQTSELKSALK